LERKFIFVRLWGSGGKAHCKQKFPAFHMEERWDFVGCVYTQPVLAILPANFPKGVCVLREHRRTVCNT